MVGFYAAGVFLHGLFLDPSLVLSVLCGIFPAEANRNAGNRPSGRFLYRPVLQPKERVNAEGLTMDGSPFVIGVFDPSAGTVRLLYRLPIAIVKSP